MKIVGCLELPINIAVLFLLTPYYLIKNIVKLYKFKFGELSKTNSTVNIKNV